MERPVSITIEPAADEQQALSTLLLAFGTDPIMRWLYPEPRQYFTCFPEFAKLLGGAAFERGTAHGADDYRAVALWLPPGTHPDGDALGEFMQRTVPERDHERVFGFFGQLDDYHPTEDHWYLPLIGVDPSCQGRGYGSALLAHALAECDRASLPAYLESSSSKNLPLYERHGFEVLAELRGEDTPSLWPMLRQPR